MLQLVPSRSDSILCKPSPRGPDLSLGEVLGTGGLGYVQVGRQHALKRDVAVKRISGDWRISHKAESLISEARLAGSLEHPNIIPIHLLAQSETGEPLIVMKRVEGESWSHTLREDGPLWPLEKGDLLVKHMRIFLQICRALEYAHSRDVLHLDILKYLGMLICLIRFHFDSHGIHINSHLSKNAHNIHSSAAGQTGENRLFRSLSAIVSA